jgi:predicted transcriptional regulator
MKYRQHIRDAVATSGNTLGTKLGRAAVRLDFSVVRIAELTGATRATVYSWFYGNEVSNAYKPTVTRLTNILRDAPTAAAAWSTACRAIPTQDNYQTESSSGSRTRRS